MFDGYKCQWGDGDFRSRFFYKLYSLMFGQDVKKQVHISTRTFWIRKKMILHIC